jgi:hypothetical protein
MEASRAWIGKACLLVRPGCRVEGLTTFAADARAGATRGVGSGRRRQGKSYLLQVGETKWDRVMEQRHVDRLRRARDLLAVKGFDTRDTVLACYSGAGFHPELAAEQPADVRLIGLGQLYAS